MSCFNNNLKNIFSRKSKSKSKFRSCSTSFFLIKLFAVVVFTSSAYSANALAAKAKTKDHDSDRSDLVDVELSRTLSAVGTGPYFGIGSEYDGSDLVVLQPNIHKDLALLKQHQLMAKYAGHKNDLANPYVQISGYLESQFIAESLNNNKINLTASNIDISAWVNRYMSGYTNFGVDTDDANDQFFRMILGFVTLGNLNDSPFYMSVGQMFVPFGSYSSGTTYIGSIPRSMGRTLQQAVSFGYYEENGWHLTGAIYDGKTKNARHFSNEAADHTSHKRIDQYAGTIAYQNPFKLYELPSKTRTGISYTNNIADALVTRTLFNRAALRHYVPAIDIFNKTNIGPFGVKAEYLTALEHYSKKDVLVAEKSVHPSSVLGELEYDTLVYGKGTAFVLHYSRILDGSLTSIFKHQTGFNVSMNVLKDTIVSFEYAKRGTYSSHHNLPTPTATTFQILNAQTVAGLNRAMDGKTKDSFVMTVDLFF